MESKKLVIKKRNSEDNSELILKKEICLVKNLLVLSINGRGQNLEMCVHLTQQKIRLKRHLGDKDPKTQPSGRELIV